MIEEIFGDMDIDVPIINEINRKMCNQREYEALLKDNPNSIVLVEALLRAESQDRELKEMPRKLKAWLNLLKVLIADFNDDPYYNSKIGWLIWFLVCYAKYDSYYPLEWAFCYDPANHYLHDEPWRPAGMEKTRPDDPFNIRGECQIHPEWYQKKAETGKANWKITTEEVADVVQ